MRRQFLIAGVALVIALGTVLALGTISASMADPLVRGPLDDEVQDRQISFEGYESGVWPYLSKEQSYRRTSPVNVAVRGETRTVVDVLRDPQSTNRSGRTAGEESATGDDRFGTTPDDAGGVNDELVGPDWEPADGATRYAHVSDGTNDTWVDETAQLQTGTYYGHRHHVRLYESPNESEQWVAMQAHSEHFDWFTLRHEVSGTETAQNVVESTFSGDPRVEAIWRTHVENDDRHDSDGWITVVELVLLVGLLSSGSLSIGRRRLADGERSDRRRDGSSLVATPDDRIGEWLDRYVDPADRRRLRSIRDRLSLRKALLVGTIVSLLLGVRLAGIHLERHAEFLTMHQIAGILYPFIGAGIPIATYVLACGIERRTDAAVTASVGLTAGVVLDYVYLGLDVVPIVVLIQRAAVIVALGLIAGGAAKRVVRESRLNGLLITGVVLWVVLLAATLFGRI